MSKTASVALKAHLALEVTTLCTCWLITRRDDQEFFFTDHDVDLVVGGDTYISAVGYQRTAISSNANMSVDNVEMVGIFDDATITEDDMRAGLFDGADVRVFLVNYADLSQGIMRLRRGILGEVSLTLSGVFKTQLNGFGQLMQQTIGDLYSPSCRADLGDEACGVDLEGDGWLIHATVSALGDQHTFNITYTEPRAVDDWFNDGVVTWLTGNNAGRSMEVKDWAVASSTVGLFLPMPNSIQIGDTLTIYPGCNKSVAHCRDRFDNILNMRAEPYVPGADTLLQAPRTSG